MKKLLLLLLVLPAIALAEGRIVKFPAQCFTYADFVKKIEFFEEVPIIVGVKEDKDKDKDIVLVSVLYNHQEDTFSVVQFNKEVGCFITVGNNLKFNLQGLKPQDIK